MKFRLFVLLAVAAIGGANGTEQESTRAMADVRLMTLDPGHFHAALIQKEMYPGVAARVDVFAPFGSDLVEHLKRITSFNRRVERPTTWQMEIHTGPDFVERMLRERPGNVEPPDSSSSGASPRATMTRRLALPRDHARQHLTQARVENHPEAPCCRRKPWKPWK